MLKSMQDGFRIQPIGNKMFYRHVNEHVWLGARDYGFYHHLHNTYTHWLILSFATCAIQMTTSLRQMYTGGGILLVLFEI